MVAARGISKSQGAIQTAFNVAYAASLFFDTWLADALGPKRVMFWSTWLTALSTLAFACCEHSYRTAYNVPVYPGALRMADNTEPPSAWILESSQNRPKPDWPEQAQAPVFGREMGCADTDGLANLTRKIER